MEIWAPISVEIWAAATLETIWEEALDLGEVSVAEITVSEIIWVSAEFLINIFFTFIVLNRTLGSSY